MIEIKLPFTTLLILTSLLACGYSQNKKDPIPEAPLPLPSTADGLAATEEQKLDLVIPEDLGFASQNKHFVATLEWLSPLKAKQKLKARLIFATSQRTAPTSVSEIIFDPQMRSMGHGTYTDDQVITKEGSSEYIFAVEGIYFTMGGPWEVDITAEVDGNTDTVVIPVKIP
jgi:hypothetical protein